MTADATTSAPSPLPDHEALRRALLIRRVEEAFLDLFSQGQLMGTVHTCLGQEFSALAFAGQLEPREGHHRDDRDDEQQQDVIESRNHERHTVSAGSAKKGGIPPLLYSQPSLTAARPCTKPSLKPLSERATKN